MRLFELGITKGLACVHFAPQQHRQWSSKSTHWTIHDKKSVNAVNIMLNPTVEFCFWKIKH